MPTYEYRCPNGHIIEEFHRMSDDIPRAVACVEHGAIAPRAYSAPMAAGVAYVHPDQNWTEEERAQRQAPPPLTNEHYHCEACALGFDDVVDRLHGEDPKAPRPCPSCGEPAPWVFVPAHVDGSLVTYPRFDRGLGIVLESEQHRRQVCRERGLIPVDGDYDVSRMYNDSMRKYRKAEAYCKDLDDQMKNSPAWAAHRRQVDRMNEEFKRHTAPKETA